MWIRNELWRKDRTGEHGRELHFMQHFQSQTLVWTWSTSVSVELRVLRAGKGKKQNNNLSCKERDFGLFRNLPVRILKRIIVYLAWLLCGLTACHSASCSFGSWGKLSIIFFLMGKVMVLKEYLNWQRRWQKWKYHLMYFSESQFLNSC